MQSKPRSKILCVHQSAELYGSDRSFLSAVAALTGKGQEVDVVLPFDGPLAVELRNVGANIEFYPYGVIRKSSLKRPFSYFFEILRSVLFYFVRFSKYDRIYINTVVVLAALLAASPWRLIGGKKIFCHVREIPSNKVISIFRFILRVSGVGLIYNSGATAKAFSVPGVVVHNGVDDIPGSRVAGGSPDRARSKKILVIGRINSWKGQDFLLRALSLLKSDEIEKVEVRIVGSAFEGAEAFERELISYVKDNGLDKVVSFYEFCPDPSSHYLWCDYVAVPSKMPEPFGRVAVEAFSAGKPVIAAAHGGLLEIVTENVNGFFFSPKSVGELSSLIASLPVPSDDEYLRLSTSARLEYERRFSVEKYKAAVAECVLGDLKK